MSQTIALLSQPNVGKSTLFNGLTGLRQHVGNWPGKTVEKKTGSFTYNNRTYQVTDLPGSYSLSANSDEEIVTRDYISNDECSVVCIMVDSSQLERSMYMLADYCGIEKPTMLVLNMMDIAKKQGKKIDVKNLEKKLDIPVVAMSASNAKEYNDFYTTLDRAIKNPRTLKYKKLSGLYEELMGADYQQLVDVLSLLPNDVYSPMWLASKIIENDEHTIEMAKSNLDENGINKLEDVLKSIKNGNLKTGECKFNWINTLLDEVVENTIKTEKYKLNWFDRLMTKRFIGKTIALFSLLIGLVLSIIIGMPIMSIGFSFFTSFSGIIHELMSSIGAPIWLKAVTADLLCAALGYTIAMAGLVLGVTFVFGLLEEIGFMARVSYAFDNTFSKMGLQGKSIMPLIVSFGCNMGGAYSSRIIDTWGQKVLTIALAWAIPCAGCWGVIALLAGIYFGSSIMIVIIALFMAIVFHIWLTAKIFKPKLVPKSVQTGLIMELPPFHKPKWKQLIRHVLGRFVHVFWKAFKVVFVVTIALWILSGYGTLDVTSSILYKFGKFFEPVTSVFGLNWQLFIAWITSLLGKEATLGVFSALFTSSGSMFITRTFGAEASNELSSLLLQYVTKPQALAFIFAFTFNVPCLMTISTTNSEIHSIKWTTYITLYYIASSLIYAFIAYNIGMLIW